MRAASTPGAPERLLRIEPASGRFGDGRPEDLASLLEAGDVLVLNDAATLPASLRGHTALGEPVEVRLVASIDATRFRAVLLGAGDWHTRTEHRPAPPALASGARIDFAGSDDRFQCIVEGVDLLSDRLVVIRFDREGAALFRALYARGHPIQYAHVPEALELWSVQTAYAGRPWAVEMPSAGRPLSVETLLALGRRGVEVATLTHAAGLSATGDPAIDAALPLPERFEIPAATVARIQRARARGARVVATGTSVVRALEGSFALHGELRPGAGVTDLVIGERTRLHVVDALLTGMHERDASHFALLRAFAPLELLEQAYAHAEDAGYLGHEFGDVTLILGPRARGRAA